MCILSLLIEYTDKKYWRLESRWSRWNEYWNPSGTHLLIAPISVTRVFNAARRRIIIPPHYALHGLAQREGSQLMYGTHSEFTATNNQFRPWGKNVDTMRHICSGHAAKPQTNALNIFWWLQGLTLPKVRKTIQAQDLIIICPNQTFHIWGVSVN